MEHSVRLLEAVGVEHPPATRACLVALVLPGIAISRRAMIFSGIAADQCGAGEICERVHSAPHLQSKWVVGGKFVKLRDLPEAPPERVAAFAVFLS